MRFGKRPSKGGLAAITGAAALRSAPAALSLGDAQLVDAIRRYGLRLQGKPRDYDGLLDQIGGARLVLIGEATHGTHEFYRERAELTKRLITEYGFSGVAAEADWPDAYRVNRYVRGASHDRNGNEALADFTRFPAWMWRNTATLDFVEWLRAHNEGVRSSQPRVGFYGVDLYSLFASMQAVVSYLDRVDPEAARRARYRYSCFDHFGEDSQSYGYAAHFELSSSCESEVVEELADLRRQACEHPGAAPLGEDERFFAEQNARVVANAEAYYRAMFHDAAGSWNLRDRHMAETLDALLRHLDREHGRTKLVVWAHNSHLGDARATDMGSAGELNLGELVRKKYGHQAVLIGMSTYRGTVTAATDWGGNAEWKLVRPALPGSYEAIFHAAHLPRVLLGLRDPNEAVVQLRARRLERAIGVVYRPDTERLSHYFEASLPEQFDYLIHIDDTRAVVPLERSSEWPERDMPETFPRAL